MQLRHSPTSPFVRKVMVAALEKGLADRIETVPTNVWDPATDIGGVNPLGQVPALVLNDGTVLYDSAVICEYLDSLAAAPRLFPAVGPARWRALTLQALADGILEAGLARLVEGRRPDPAQRSSAWIERQWGKVIAGLDALEADAASLRLGDDLTIAEVTVGCALGWLDFRFSREAWASDPVGRPRTGLARWFDAFAARPSLRATMPRE